MAVVHLGDCRDILATIADNSIDSIVTDPPYELGFMGKAWDNSGIAYDVTVWQQCLRVLKPGGHLVAFGGSRTYHRLAVAIEDAGFEIRDQIQWIYGSGFPKSLDVSKALDKVIGKQGQGFVSAGHDGRKAEMKQDLSFRSDYGYTYEPTTDLAKQWQGWGSALKPAHEPAVLARKPLCGTVADNVTTWGVGVINVDGTRVGVHQTTTTIKDLSEAHGNQFGKTGIQYPKIGEKLNPPGRWPANVIFDEEAAQVLDAQSGHSVSTNTQRNHTKSIFNAPNKITTYGHSDSGGASRFFYVAKASKAEREAGLDGTCTVKYNIDRSILGGLSWKDVSTAAVQLLQRVTSDLATLKWLIGESGENITALYPRDSLFITSMEISKITALKTCNLLMHLLTSESIADVNCEAEYGSSLAKNAEQLKVWILNTTNGKTELALGAANVALTTLQQINEKEPSERNNVHSTVKPITLMRYLVRMVTPKGGIVLDPFTGSGSTGCAAVLEGCDFVGMDITPEYVAIAQKRIAYYAVESPLL